MRLEASFGIIAAHPHNDDAATMIGESNRSLCQGRLGTPVSEIEPALVFDS
jgi:hypothetical protein